MEVLDRLAAAVDEVSAAESWRAGSGELLELLDGIETSLRRLHAASVGVVGEIESRGVAAEVGATSTRNLLQWRLHLSGRDASGRVYAARELSTAVAATAAGEIGAEQLRLIGETVRAVPDQQRAAAEELLVGYARELDHAELVKAAKHLREVVNPDGRPPAEETEPHRELRMTGDGTGGTIGSFRLDPEGAATLKAALDPLSAPRPETPEGKDTRSLAARRGDALVELARRGLDSEQLPGKPQVGVLIDFEKSKQCGGSPATPKSSPSCYAEPPSHWISVESPAPCPRRSGVRYSLGTADVPSRAAIARPAGAMRITFAIGHRVGRPRCTIWCCFARIIIG